MTRAGPQRQSVSNAQRLVTSRVHHGESYYKSMTHSQAKRPPLALQHWPRSRVRPLSPWSRIVDALDSQCRRFDARLSRFGLRSARHRGGQSRSMDADVCAVAERPSGEPVFDKYRPHAVRQPPHQPSGHAIRDLARITAPIQIIWGESDKLAIESRAEDCRKIRICPSAWPPEANI